MTPDVDRWYWNPESIIRVQEFFGPNWELPFRTVTLLADSTIVLLLAAIIFWTRGRRVAYTALAATMTGAFLVMVIKLGVDVPRPEHADMIAFESRVAPSFPSGHAMHVVAFWGTLAYLGLLRVRLVVAIAIAVILSRIYLGIHYPADLFVGALIGLGGVLTGYLVWTQILSRLTDQQVSALLGATMVSSAVLIPVASRLPHGWEILGGLLGAGLGTLVESRRIDYQPASRGTAVTLARAAIGAGGLLACGLIILFSRNTGGAPWLATLAVFPLGLWATCVGPFVLDRLGLNDAPPQIAGEYEQRVTSL